MPAQTDGTWGNLQAWPIIGIHSVVMDDGRVLTFGTDNNGMQGGQFIYDIYNPVTGEHETLTNTTTTDIFCSAAMIIPGEDKILIAGGDGRPDGKPNTGVNDVNILDMKTGELYAAPDGDMVNQRWYPTMVSLDNGQMIMLGGSDSAGRHMATPEIYTYGEGWKPLTGATDANLGVSGHYPRAFLDTDGKVVYFATGGGGNGQIEVMSLDPSGNGSVTQIGTLPFNAAWDNPAVQYASGKILIQDTGSGLWSMDISGGGVSFEKVGDMGAERNWSNMTTLADGTVLINGGSARGNTEAAANHTAMIWDPKDNSLTTTVDEASSRLYHSTSVLLNDGTILSAGGGAAGFAEKNYLDAQAYKPPYLYDDNGNLADRPVVEIAPSEVHAGSAYNIRVDDGADVARITMVKNGASTHAFNMGTGFVEVPFKAGSGDNITVYTPTVEQGLSSGSWMMFVWDKNGVPSIAPNIDVQPSNVPLAEDPENILVNGSFEVPNPTDKMTTVNQMEGWTSSNGRFEIHGDKNIDANATHGHTALGLDGASGAVSQTVDTVRGQTYDLSFTYETEAMGANIWKIGLEVLWNDEIIATLKPDNGDVGSYDFKVVGTGGDDKLTFQATKDTNLLLGGLVDNVVLKSDGTDPVPMPDPVDPDPVDPDPVDPDPVDPDPVDPDPVDPDPVDPANLLTNGSFETSEEVTNWETHSSLTGWQSSRNNFELWQDGYEGIAATDGKTALEIDSERGVISQSVATQENKTYDLTFDYEVRTGHGDRAGMDILWNGSVVQTVKPGHSDPGSYSVTVVGTGGNDELSFLASDGTHPSIGGLLDNVVLKEGASAPTDPDPVDPDPVDPDPVDPDPVDPDPVDPDPVDPDPVDPDPVDPDPVDPTNPVNEVNDIANGTQWVTGTADKDVFVIKGQSKDYGWGPTEDGTGTVVWGPTGFDILQDFEEIRFDDFSVPLTSEDGSYQDVAGVTQYLTGTTDNDRFVIDGKASDFGWGPTNDGTGVVVWGASGFDILHGFESLEFSDMSVPLTTGSGQVQDIAGVTQYLTGTEGQDSFKIDGNAADYNWGATEDGAGVVVWSGNDFDILYDFEELAFNDQSVAIDQLA